jgi:hypothetical protein
MKTRLLFIALPLKVLLISSLLVITTGCSKSKDDNDSAATYYYKAKIGGEDHSQKVTSTNTVVAGSITNGFDKVELVAYVGPDIPNQANTLTISKGLLLNYLSISQEQFLAFFTPGSYPYTTGSGNGFIVTWIDAEGKFWASDNGTGDQTGSTIQIISASPDPQPQDLDYYVRVKIVLNCKLYKEGTGEMKQLTSGEFVGLFGFF